jgi:serine/threonine protein kinase
MEVVLLFVRRSMRNSTRCGELRADCGSGTREPPMLAGDLSHAARDFFERLLDKNPDARLGGGPRDVEEVKEHPFFAGLNWDDVLAKRIKPESIPHYEGSGSLSSIDYA